LDARAPTAHGLGTPRLLTPADLEACLHLDRRALGGFWREEQWRRELLEPLRPVLGMAQGLAPPGGADPGPGLAAVACGWLVVDELHITLVAVDPAHRRRGLGHAVLTALLAEARRGGARHATLEVASDNDPARALYTACGFRDAGVRRGYYRNGDDALIQWARLTA